MTCTEMHLGRASKCSNSSHVSRSRSMCLTPGVTACFHARHRQRHAQRRPLLTARTTGRRGGEEAAEGELNTPRPVDRGPVWGRCAALRRAANNRQGVAAWRRGGVAAWRRGGVAAWRGGEGGTGHAVGLKAAPRPPI
jgi:hypothetical protein